MSSYFDRLNLRPQERRLVVLSGTMFFVMLNLWFVKPHFQDWRDVGGRLEAANNKLQRYTNEVSRLQEYEAKRKELESAGANVLPAGQSLLLLRTVQALTSSNHLNVTSWGRATPITPTGQQTNTFIDEWNLTLRFNAGESEVVDFLYNLGAGNSLIRVGSLELYPGPAATNLEGSLTLVATYQRKEEPKKPATRVAATPVKKP